MVCAACTNEFTGCAVYATNGCIDRITGEERQCRFALCLPCLTTSGTVAAIDDCKSVIENTPDGESYDATVVGNAYSNSFKGDPSVACPVCHEEGSRKLYNGEGYHVKCPNGSCNFWMNVRDRTTQASITAKGLTGICCNPIAVATKLSAHFPSLKEAQDAMDIHISGCIHGPGMLEALGSKPIQDLVGKIARASRGHRYDAMDALSRLDELDVRARSAEDACTELKETVSSHKRKIAALEDALARRETHGQAPGAPKKRRRNAVVVE